MNYSQIAILLLQGALVSFLILLLFRLRKQLGIGTLFACLGLFQLIQVFLSSTVYVKIANHLTVSPGSSVFFTATLFAILIIYIKEDASETKKLIYALFIVNIIMTILLQTFGWNIEDTSTQNQFKITTALFNNSAWVLFVGTVVLFLDSLLVIILFEFMAKKIKSFFLQIFLTMLLVIIFDTLFFSILAFWGSENLMSILISGMISKGFFAFFYSVIFYAYLIYFESDFESVTSFIKIKDVFQPLSYKQKFEVVLEDIKKVKEEREKELVILNKEKEKRIVQLAQANIELAFKNEEKEKQAIELELSKQKIQEALEQVQENEYSLNQASRMAKLGYWSYDKITDSIFWSNPIHQIYGTDPKKGVPAPDQIFNSLGQESAKKLMKATELLESKGVSYDLELQVTNLKNEQLWIRNIAEPIYNDTHEIVGRRGVLQDITHRKLTQNKLDHQNKKLVELNKSLNLAQKLSNVGSWQWNMTTDEAEWSDEMYNIYGVTKGSFYPSNKNVVKTVLAEDLYKIEQGISSLLVDKMFVPFEFRIQRPSGEIRTLYIMALEKDSDESVFGVTKDITEQKQIEEKNLRITEEYKELFENVTISIWNEDISEVFEELEVLKKRNILNIKTYLENNPEVLFSLIAKVKVNSVNKATLKLFRAKSRQHFFNNIQTTFGEGAEKVFINLIEAIWKNKKTFTSEVKYKKLDGEEFTALMSVPIPQTIAKQKTVPISIQNIQSIKEAELEKKESIRRLKEAQHLANVGSWLYTPSNKKTEWSDETFRIWCFDSEKPTPDEDMIINRIHIDDVELFHKSAHLASTLGIPYDIEFRIYIPNQEYKTIRSICKPIFDEQGKVVRLRGTNQDVTAQKRAMLEIRKAEELYRILTDNSNDLICMHEIDSTFKYISPSIKSLLGYDATEFIGKLGFDLIHKEDVAYFKKSIEERVLRKTGKNTFFCRVIHKNGHFLWFEFSTSVVYMSNKINYILTSSRDVTVSITAKKEIEEYQASLQKLTTEITLIEEKQKKEIASNIHDHLSQSLVISKMRINELKRNPLDKVISDGLQFIETHISEALENSRKITYELSPPVLYQLGIVEALNWLLEDVERNHKIAYSFNSNVNNVRLSDVASILLYRSIQEIIKNTIKYANASLITLNFNEINGGMQIYIADDGVGFDTLILKNVHSHRGKGFGLFTVQERIINIKGKFTIESELNSGTTVKFFIPLATDLS